MSSTHPPEATTATLHRCGGRDERGVADFAAAFVERHARRPPAVSWFEPRPDLPAGGTPGPIEGFAGLWLGMPTLDGLLLDEAQLSWSNGLLRVAAAGSGCRWFACGTRHAV